MDRLKLFGNLVVMALSDGKVTEEERELLANRAARWGLTAEEVEEALRTAATDESEMSIPEDPTVRAETLREMARMMKVDGELAAIERSLCAAAAMAMDINSVEFREILDSA